MNNQKHDKAPAKKEITEGDWCNKLDCDGVYSHGDVEGCSCHISPPCHACEDNPLCCTTCGYMPDESVLRDDLPLVAQDIKLKWFESFPSCVDISPELESFANSYPSEDAFDQDLLLTFGYDLFIIHDTTKIEKIGLLMREKLKNYENLAPAQKELIDRVRRDLGKYGAQLSDEQILEHWDGSLELASLDFHWSWVELKRAINAALPKWFRSLVGWS